MILGDNYTGSQFNDILLDEHILDEDSMDDIQHHQIGSEAKNQNANIANNFYKFRGTN